MRTSTTNARQRLRAADPASRLVPVDAMQLEHALTTAKLASTEPADPGPGLRLSDTRGRQAAAALVAACAIVLVLAAVIGIIATRSQHNTRQAMDRTNPTSSRHGQIDPKGTPTDVDHPDRAQALTLVQAVLATLPSVPGARQQASAPTRSLKDVDFGEGPGKLIDRARFWTAPGTVGAAIDYLQHHAPPHTDSDGPNAPGTVEFEPTTAQLGSIVVRYRVMSHAGSVAIRADVQDLWFPRKSPAQVIGAVTSVDVVTHRSLRTSRGVKHFPTVRRTFVGARAQRLAAAVDAAPVGDSAIGCPASLYSLIDRLAFHTRSRTITVTDTGSTCPRLTLQRSGDRPLGLLGNIDPLVLKSLGLPADYGR